MLIKNFFLQCDQDTSSVNNAFEIKFQRYTSEYQSEILYLSIKFTMIVYHC